MNSRRKGVVGERQWRDQLRAAGWTARRGQQFSGSPDSPDVVCPELDGLHFEVKRTERFNAYEAMDQAADDAGDRIPVVAHKRNRHPWLVVLRADDFFGLLRSCDLDSLTPGGGREEEE